MSGTRGGVVQVIRSRVLAFFVALAAVTAIQSPTAATAELGTAAATSGASTAESQTCAVTGADLEWGFKESFRSYISSTIASGDWSVADGARYETPIFYWSGGDGDFDGRTMTGTVSFTGSITFTGHDGILNTTVANPAIRFDGREAVLLVDVAGTTQDGVAVSEQAVEFVSIDLGAGVTTSADNVVTVRDAPAVLLPTGAAAFGTYEAGEPFDRIRIDIPTESECAQLATPPVWLWIAIGVVLLFVAAIISFVVIRRRA
nr:HtaA domain-containing protein [Cryobacterium sp. BB307]